MTNAEKRLVEAVMLWLMDDEDGDFAWTKEELAEEIRLSNLREEWDEWATVLNHFEPEVLLENLEEL